MTINEKLFNHDHHPRPRLSSMGKDLMEHYNQIINPIEPDEKLKRIFDLGNMIEQYIFSRDDSFYNIDMKVHTGIIDHLGNEVIGEIDAMQKDGIEYIVDIKSMSDNSYNKFVSALDVKQSHYAYYVQLQLYMHFLGIPDAKIIAYNKNNSDMAEVPVAYDEEFAKKQVRRLEVLIQHLKDGREPELEYPNVRQIKTRKVRNKDEWEGVGIIVEQPHPINKFNEYINTEVVEIEAPETKGVIYTKAYPDVTDSEDYIKRA